MSAREAPPPGAHTAAARAQRAPRAAAAFCGRCRQSAMTRGTCLLCGFEAGTERRAASSDDQAEAEGGCYECGARRGREHDHTCARGSGLATRSQRERPGADPSPDRTAESAARSERDLRIARLAADGLSFAAIGREVGLSARSVRRALQRTAGR